MEATMKIGALIISLLFGVSMLAPPQTSLGQEEGSEKDSEEEPSAIRLEEIVVTATRTERSLAEVPASVSVITEDEIQTAPAQNIDEILRTESGVDVKRVVGMGSGIPSMLSIRGVPGANRTLVLVDGMPANASGTGFISFNEVPLDSIERVEVVRGPFSSLYGANAFGGVINIITREGEGKPGAQIHGGLGSEGLWEAGAQSSGEMGRFSYSVLGDVRSIDNYLARDHDIDRSYRSGTWTTTTKEVVNHDYEDLRFVGKFNFRIGDESSLTLHTRYFDSELGGCQDSCRLNRFHAAFLAAPMKSDAILSGLR